jgi:hypothetical protein
MKTNKKLIFRLSLFGLFMAIATISLIPPQIEPLFWLVIFIVCAVAIAKKVAGRYFLHGFLVSMLNCVWILFFHLLFFEKYITNHPGEVAMLEKSPLPYSLRISMIMIGPFLGIVSGLILGSFCVIAAKTIKKKKHVS